MDLKIWTTFSTTSGFFTLLYCVCILMVNYVFVLVVMAKELSYLFLLVRKHRFFNSRKKTLLPLLKCCGGLRTLPFQHRYAFYPFGICRVISQHHFIWSNLDIAEADGADLPMWLRYLRFQIRFKGLDSHGRVSPLLLYPERLLDFDRPSGGWKPWNGVKTTMK